MLWRIGCAALASKPVEEGGYVWVPLQFEPGSGVATPQINSLTAQAEDLFRIAAEMPKEDELRL